MIPSERCDALPVSYPPCFPCQLTPPLSLGSSSQEFKGYIFKIKGGQDKQGVPMRQGVMTPLRVRLLMSPGDPCMLGYGRRKGERRRKSVRGCIVSPDLSVLNLVIVKQGKPTWCNLLQS